ncbi:MAG: YggT family protein [Salinisphaera sp.]|nr:YggT family protein [Salinisphaera sp.]MDN5939258.1 YggT family protein [Salinisphaera sp.]
MVAGPANALLFLIDTLFALYIIALLLRALLQITHADFYNPVSQFIWRVTRAPVDLLTKLIPRWRNIDLAALVLVLLLCFANIELKLWLVQTAASAPLAAWWALLKAAALLCNLFTFTILIQALASWLAPTTHSPATAVLWSVNEPLLGPVRRWVPPIGGLDISPLIVIIALQVVSRLLPLPGLLR